MGQYILTLDQGTTSSRAILFDREQRMVAVAQKELRQIYPREGWVELGYRAIDLREPDRLKELCNL